MVLGTRTNKRELILVYVIISNAYNFYISLDITNRVDIEILKEYKSLSNKTRR